MLVYRRVYPVFAPPRCYDAGIPLKGALETAIICRQMRFTIKTEGKKRVLKNHKVKNTRVKHGTLPIKKAHTKKLFWTKNSYQTSQKTASPFPKIIPSICCSDFFLGGEGSLPCLKLTVALENRPGPKRKGESLPIIRFQVRLLAVSFREGRPI